MLDLPALIMMMTSDLSFRKATLYIMPPFTPTDSMLLMHADKGNQDWEIYAWCVRDAIAKFGNLKKTPINVYKERDDFYAFMNKRLDVISVQGKTFSYGNNCNDDYQKIN